ncbi:aspartic proteinase CDR1-like [Actinidia eriantha]|uniref:aspartic proteinase CDR1-like n=1 Tax=Actinidia eriantha TaxID=165200 RepID=UPI0025876C9F|nr:aspartic proteinase CDR1-like [Actinidia eriantha]
MALVMIFHMLFSIALAVTVSIMSPSPLSLAKSDNLGFSVDLIHRDSPMSPYNHSLTPFECIGIALKRSSNRVNYFKLASLSAQAVSTEVIARDGQYLMKMAIGSTKFSFLAIADTGSDLIWIRCSPSTRCYKRKAPLFNPKRSLSYEVIPCNSKKCKSVPGSFCSRNGTCSYLVMYGDKSFSHGIVGTETVLLDSSARKPASLPGIIFGCGYHNRGTFSESASGIVGLGGGEVSLVSQMGSSIGGKFSYCLVPLLSQNAYSSRMHFGAKAKVVGKQVTTTPIIPTSMKTFYFLGLEGFSVAGRRLEIYDSSSSPTDIFGAFKKLPIIIDSGTTLTYLPSNAYTKLELAVRVAVKSRPIGDPQNRLKLCYRYNKTLALPIIVAHFTGANLTLNPMNTFLPTGPGVLCLAFLPDDNVAIFGSVAQMNFLVGYDLAKKTVSFKPTDCTKK